MSEGENKAGKEEMLMVSFIERKEEIGGNVGVILKSL